jgi:hypothetical protein
MITNFIQLDFNKENDLKVPSVQYDSGSRFVKIKLQRNKSPFEIDGYRVTVVANKVDGTEIMNDCTILDGVNGVVQFEITEQFNAVEGVVDCQLKLFKGKTLLTSMPFSINVVKSVSTKEIVSSNELKTLVNALGEVQNIDNRFAQTNAQLSAVDKSKASKEEVEIERKRIDGFIALPNGSTTGDAELIDARIGADGKSYQSVGSSIRTQFNQTHINLGKYCLKEIKMTSGYNINLSVGVGNIVNMNPEPIGYYRYAVIDCEEGDKFTINGTGGNSPRLWGFVDANNILLSVANVNETASELLLVAPKGTAKLIINTNTDSISYTGGDISKITKNITKIESTLFKEEIKRITGYNINLSAGIGNVVDLTPEKVDAYKYSVVNCEEGDKFTINGTGGSNPRLWGFVDVNNILLSVAEPYETANNKLIIAPKGTAKLIINNDNANSNQTSYINGKLFDATDRLTRIESVLFKEEITMRGNYCIELGSVGVANIVNMTPSLLSDYRYAVIDCEEGDRFTINGTGGSNPRLWGFVDVNNILLSVAEPFETANDKLIIAPKGTAKLIINDKKTGTTSYIGADMEDSVDTLREKVDLLLEDDEKTNIDILKNTIDLEMFGKELHDIDTRNTAMLFPKDLSVGVGSSSLEIYNDNGIYVPCWLMPKENTDQSLVGYVTPLGEGYDGVEISITIVNPYANLDEQNKEVFFTLINPITYGTSMSTGYMFTSPVVHKTSNQGIVDRIVLKNLVRIDTTKPFMLSVYRKVDDANDTNANAIGIISVEVTPVKPITIQEPNQYSAWPFIISINDKLVCVYARSQSHTDNTTTDVFKKTSTDGGKTWSREYKIVDTVNVRDTATGKGYDSDGNALFWIRKGAPSSQTETHHLYRTSDGDTFTLISSPVFAEVPAHIGDIFEVPTLGLVAFYNTLSATRSWGIVFSSDNGATWEQRQIETGLSFAECPVEISGVYLGDGKILAIGRKEEASTDGTYAQFQIQSSDFGLNWTKEHTNITDIRSSTASLIYDKRNNLLSQYYFHRGVGVLRLRKAEPNDVWNNPLNWADSEEIAYASTNPQDAGNVNAVPYGDKHIAVYYSGDDVNTGIYAKIVEQ